MIFSKGGVLKTVLARHQGIYDCYKMHILKNYRTAEVTNLRYLTCLKKALCNSVNVVRQYSSNNPSKDSSDCASNVCNVWVSESQDIFANLALEHWLYSEKNTKVNHLFFWKNNPCVVIGRHQNPWAECNVHSCEKNNVLVARRNSGGGAVYHDPGNVCVSFFTPRDGYNRKMNLEVIVDGVVNRWPIDLSINGRDDIILEGLYKISGTAAKLGRSTAYHHCTLLLDVNKFNLNHYLSTEMVGLVCQATESVRANVKNMHEVDTSISFDELVHTISEEYCKRINAVKKITSVDPRSEKRFPGVGEIEEELKSWKWIYGRTPKFNIQRTFIDPSLKERGMLELSVEVEKGHFSLIEMGNSHCEIQTFIRNSLLGKRFTTEDVIRTFESSFHNFRGTDAQVYLWIWRCFQKLLSC